PVEEFRLIAVRAFRDFFDRVADAIEERVASLTPDQLDDPLAHLGLRRPSATWTYMVRDDPFADAAGRAALGLRRMIRDALTPGSD
ncbi:MAG: hypothetical protein WA971_08750, partial [Microbacterium sp.]